MSDTSTSEPKQPHSAIDWQSKPEPWRSTGLRFCEDLRRIMAGEPTRNLTPSLKPLSAMRQFRRERGWTLAELERRCGHDRSSLSLFERGVRRPKPQKLRDIAEALGVDVEDILW